jgi:hypothetical protein
MLIVRYEENGKPLLAAVTLNDKVHALPQQDFQTLAKEAKARNISLLELVKSVLSTETQLNVKLEDLRLLTPVDALEVWA